MSAEPFSLSLEDENESDEEDEQLVSTAASKSGAAGSEAKAASGAFLAAIQAVQKAPWSMRQWRILLEEAKEGRSGQMSAEVVHEDFFRRFPAAASEWLDYVHYQRDLGADEEELEKIYDRAISNCCDVDLWLDLIRFKLEVGGGPEVAFNAEDSGDALRAQLVIKFEGALEQVGLSVYATPLWREYLDFVRRWPESSAALKTGKLAALRKIYERCSVIPINDVESLWSEYGAFERTVNEQAAAERLERDAHVHNNAAAVLRERVEYWKGLKVSAAACPPGHGDAPLKEQASQLCRWRLCIAYERSLPELADERQRTLRIAMAYRYALCALGHYPELWLEFAHWRQSLGGSSDAIKVLRAASRRLPASVVLAAALSDLLADEGRQDEAVRVLFDCVRRNRRSDLAATLWLRRTRKAYGAARERQAFGSTLARRKAGLLGWRVYACHADIEHRVNGASDVALRVYELALRLHPHFCRSANFVASYMALLTAMGDHHNLRTLLRRLLGRAARGGDPKAPPAAGTPGNGPGGAPPPPPGAGGGAPGPAEAFPEALRVALWRRFLELEETLALDGERVSGGGAVVRQMRSDAGGAFELPAHLLRATAESAPVPPDGGRGSTAGVTAAARSSAAVDAWCRATLGGMLGPLDTEPDAGFLSRVLGDAWALAPTLGLAGLSETLASAGAAVDWEAEGIAGVDLRLGGYVRLSGGEEGAGAGGAEDEGAKVLLRGALDARRSAEAEQRAREAKLRLQRQKARETAVNALPQMLQTLMQVLPEPPIGAVVQGGDASRALQTLSRQRLQPRPQRKADGDALAAFSLQDLVERRHLARGKRKRGPDDDSDDDDDAPRPDRLQNDLARRKDVFRARQVRRQRNISLGRV